MAHRVFRGAATSRQLLKVKRPQPGHRGTDANDPLPTFGGLAVLMKLLRPFGAFPSADVPLSVRGWPGCPFDRACEVSHTRLWCSDSILLMFGTWTARAVGGVIK